VSAIHAHPERDEARGSIAFQMLRAYLNTVEVNVTLHREEIVELLMQAAPLRIHLTKGDEDRRYVELERPSEVSFVPGVGVRIVTSGRLRHELAGIGLPLGIRRVQVLFKPELVQAHRGQRLDFRLRVEEADLENVPGLVENVLIPKVNQALEPSHLSMFWELAQTLTLSVPLPERFEPLDRFLTAAGVAHVAVTVDALILRANLALKLTRTRDRPVDDRAST
jgi:hypothetical protein